MKLDKESYTQEEVKKLLEWFMSKCERDQARYIANEQFIMEFIDLSWWKRAFFGRKLLNNHLYKMVFGE